MTDRYIAFDVETPNWANDRMSAIGIAVIEDGEIAGEFYTVVDPETYFDRFNIELTGITPEMAAAAVTAENLAAVIYLNQVETENDWKNARIFAAALKKTGMTVAAGSLYHHTCEILNHPSR